MGLFSGRRRMMTRETVLATHYEPLTDAEWGKIQDTIAKAMPPENPRHGRKRVHSRPVTDSVLHHVSTGLGLSHVGSAVVEYPSPPTRRRFLQALIDAKVLMEIFALLVETRPLLAAQYKEYRESRSKYVTKAVLAQKRKKEQPAPLSWGTNVAHLPWNQPVLEND
jgi:hypothetical protein